MIKALFCFTTLWSIPIYDYWCLHFFFDIYLHLSILFLIITAFSFFKKKISSASTFKQFMFKVNHRMNEHMLSDGNYLCFLALDQFIHSQKSHPALSAG